MLKELCEQVYEYTLQMVKDGIVHGSQGNISALDRQTGFVAITPTAIPYTKLKAKDICVIDLEQHILSGKWQPTSEQLLHLIYYKNRSDVGAVIHSHAPYCTAFSVIGEESIPMVINQSASCLGGPLPVAPYALPGTQELAEVTYQATGNGVGAVMAHHGLVTVGQTLEQAYDSTLAAENTARVIIMAKSMGAEVQIIPPKEIKILREAYLKSYFPKSAQLPF